MFSDIWNRHPDEHENGFWLFGDDKDGDSFNQDDVQIWQNEKFEYAFSMDKYLNNSASRKLIDAIARTQGPYIDLACGPGMGLIPSVKNQCPEILCLATDANAMLLKAWKEWLIRNSTARRIEFAQFSLFDIPVKDCCVKAYGGFLSLSSTRDGGRGYDKALSEIFRTLAPEGRLYAIESEWVDVHAACEVFYRSGIHPWNCFLEEQMTWHDRFLKNGFKIVFEEPYTNYVLNGKDNELGYAADKTGIKIEMQLNAFIIEKYS